MPHVENRTLDGIPYTVINMQVPMIECNVCGQPWEIGFGIPVWNGMRVANDWPGEWGGVPACEPCFHRHAAGEFIEVPTSEYAAIMGGGA